jgi:replicative DNA helicase
MGVAVARSGGDLPQESEFREARERSIGRVPPSDIEAEKAVLSALLLDNDAIHTVLSEVRPADFYHPAHQKIYESMLLMQDANEPVDLHTLSNFMNSRKTLDAIGGPVYLAEIADYEATAANVLYHARIVRDKSIKRGLISVATEIVEAGFEDSDRAEHLLDVAEGKILEIGQQRSKTAFLSLHEEMNEALDYVEALMERAGELTGVPTGFKGLDETTGGFQPGELIVIAARPSMGKTALALNIARNAAVDHGKKVAIFSLEMTKLALTLRLLSSEARVDFSGIRKGFGAVADHKALVKAGGALADADIWIDDSGMVTILEIKAKCRRLKSERGLDMVMVDYLQLAHGDTPTYRKDLEIGEISHGLKALAKELHLPVVALSQLNRGPEQRDPDKRRPNMGDLRESGAIEQDADVIVFIYRDEVYNPTDENRRLAELNIAKQRNGPTGTVRLTFEDKYAIFHNLDTTHGPGDEPPGLAPSGRPMGGVDDPFESGDAPF